MTLVSKKDRSHYKQVSKHYLGCLNYVLLFNSNVWLKKTYKQGYIYTHRVFDFTSGNLAASISLVGGVRCVMLHGGWGR